MLIHPVAVKKPQSGGQVEKKGHEKVKYYTTCLTNVALSPNFTLSLNYMTIII